MYSFQMGYGSRAVKLLQEYYEGKMIDISESSRDSAYKDVRGIQEQELSLLSESVGEYD